MTRKQRSNLTYDMSQPRNVAAFEALLEDEAEDFEAADTGHRSRKAQASQANANGQKKKKREKEKFFKLRDDETGAGGNSSSGPAASPSDLQALLDMFAGACDALLARDVLQSTGSLQAAAEALLAMLSGGGPATHKAAGSGGASSSSAGASSSSSAAAAAAERRWQQQQQDEAAAAAAGAAAPSSTCWSDLPGDVRAAILSHLSPRDLAKAASTCAEFRLRANALRAHVKHLVLLPGLSYNCLRGMVGSHANTRVMDFGRFERHIANLDADDLLPQVVAMHKQEAEAALFRGLVAVADGSRSSGRTAPISSLVLRRLVGATDRVVAEALQNLKHLRCIDVSHCPNITNKAVYALAKYKAAAGAGADGVGSDTSSRSQGGDAASTASQAAAGSSSSRDGSEAGDRDDEFRYLLPDDDSNGSSSSELDEEEAAELDAALAASAAAEAAATAAAAGSEGDSAAAPDAAASAAGAPPTAAAAAALSSELLALDIQASLFHHPEVTSAAGTGSFAPPEVPPPPTAVAAAAAAVGLQELKLAGNSAVLDDGLRQVLQGSLTKHSLTKLDISGCRRITSAGLILPPWGVLQDLRASRCSGLTEVHIHTPASHPLAELDLSACHFLRLVDLGLPHLRSLNLSTCRTLYRLRLRCPELTSLSLSQCGMLVDFHEDAWQVPALQQLNLWGCRRAAGLQLQAVLDTLPDLRWLSVNGCHSIQRLHLVRNLQLESVDLSGCRNLAGFSSSSAHLAHLSAASCSRLASLGLASSQLRSLLLPNCSALSEVHAVPPPPPSPARCGPAAVASAATAPVPSQQQAASASRPRLDARGCVRLAPAARAVLASAMAQQQA